MTSMERAAPDAVTTVWPALLISPLLALGHLSLAYALVALAWRTWRRLPPPGEASERVSHADASHADRRQPFLALVATLTGALSTLVIVAMWLPVWLLPPCT